MATRYEQVQQELEQPLKAWFATGAAGFIGPNIIEKARTEAQAVVGLDNRATGYRKNLDQADIVSF